ncbi:ABC transporter ATP-binding protein [Tabrizicola sp.]|uniref:ABC transporter ATP-binding protein n=1 Tax=Tabrizicola sp. TaxID=2005166 RepID=UPI00286A5851|nr:ABC transporter ATP-binding protein [Tabrizicola sp.]
MTRVSMQSLTKTYPGAQKPALDGLTLDIESGELLALLGPSGCGKTTTMKLIAGQLEPTAGEIAFDGASILHQPPDRRGAVMVFQNSLLFPYMSVADNIGFGLKMRHRPKAEIAARVADMLALVQLPDLGHRRPADLSGGQQQRVALARALIVEPRVLLLDEPLSSLDTHLRFEMRDLIRSLQKDLCITTIFVTHDQEEAVVLADRIALILDGRLRQVDRPDQFYRRPADQTVARFFGGHNFVPGTSDGAVFQSNLGPLLLPQGARKGPGTLTFRPESIRIGIGAENTLSARLVERVYLGTQTRLRLMVKDVMIEAVLSPDLVDGLETGAELDLTVPPQCLWVLEGVVAQLCPQRIHNVNPCG